MDEAEPLSIKHLKRAIEDIKKHPRPRTPMVISPHAYDAIKKVHPEWLGLPPLTEDDAEDDIVDTA